MTCIVDLNNKNILGNTPLFNAVKNKSIEVVLFLLESGVDINIPNNNNITPLIQAIINNNLEWVARSAHVTFPELEITHDTPSFALKRT